MRPPDACLGQLKFAGIVCMRLKVAAMSLAIAGAVSGFGAMQAHEHSGGTIGGDSSPRDEISPQMEAMGQDGISHEDMDREGMSAMGQSEEKHDHGMFEVSSEKPIPAVALMAHPDAKKGWNLEVQLENFEFVPAEVNQTNVQNEGHAHLFINGEKVTRLYSPWYYLGDLIPGEYEVMVTLNTNTHNNLVLEGETIAASTTLSVSE